MRKFGLALLFLFAALGGARAQAVTPGSTAVEGAIVCAYNATSPILASGQFGYAQCDQNGKIIISNPGSGGGGGGAVTQGTTPWVDNITQWASVALGAPTNYGTPPTGAVPGVNAFVTNFPATQPVSWSNQTVAATESGPWSVSISNFPATQPVSLVDGADTTLGSKADTAAGTGTVSAISIFKQLHLDLLGPNFAAVTTSPPTYTTGTTQAMSLTTAGGLRTDESSWAGTALGAPTAYGTAPTGIVPGFNAFITNPVTNSPSTGATMTTSQPSVTTTAAALAFAGSVHREIYNPASSTASIFIGGTSGVTTSTGWEVPPGSTYDLSRYTGSVYAVAASSQTVRLISY